MSLSTLMRPEKLKKLIYGLGAFAVIFLIVLGIFARNGWLPRTDGLNGKRFGWFGRELPRNASGVWNPLVALLPSSTPQLSKEYLYAGGRLLAVEDANAGATTPTPTPAPTPYGYESDLASRFTGDGIVVGGDKTIVQYFVVGIWTPEPGTNEFQRADAAPRTTLGDEIIDSSDVVQAQRYATSLDPLTSAGGPIGSGNRPESAIQNQGQYADQTISGSSLEASSNREVRVQPASTVRGQTVTLPVFMKLQRDEMAVSFTLEYDTAKLSNPRLALSGDLPATAELTTNTNQPGTIGILINALEPFSATPRELRIVLVTFDIRNTASTGSSQLRLTSSLARQSVSDFRANLLMTSYIDGDVTITN